MFRCGNTENPFEVAVAIEGLLSSFSDHMAGLNVLHEGGFTRVLATPFVDIGASWRAKQKDYQV